MRGAALDPFASLGRRANDVDDEARAGAQLARETGEAADGIDLAFAGLSQMHRMIDGGDRGDPRRSLRAAKVELLRRIGSWRDGARAVPSWLRGVGIALTTRGSAIRVNVHPVTRQDEREIAQIPRTVRPPGVGTRTPILVERVGDIVAQDDVAGEALEGDVHRELGVGEGALARMGGAGAGAAVVAGTQVGPSGGSVQGREGPIRRSVTRREASWETGAPNINMATAGRMATQAGGKLSSASRSSGGTGKRVLGAAGAGLAAAGTGAGIGASIGSVIPGIGTVIGGAIGAIGGAVAAVIHFLLGGRRRTRKLTAKERSMLNRGLYISRTRHLPGAFQDAVLYIYLPAVYRTLRAQKRLPSQVEAQLLQKRAYATHAAAVDRQHGVRLRRELAHLPPELRTLVGIGSVTGHARELYIALHHALAERARVAKRAARRARKLAFAVHHALVERARLAAQAAPAPMAPPLEQPNPPALPEPTATLEPDATQESPEDPFRDLPLARDANEIDANQSNAEAGGPLDELALTLKKSRLAQRRYLRDTWVNGTWLGDFLHLDHADNPSAPVVPAPPPGSGRPSTITLVPEPDTAAPPTNADEARAQILANLPRLPPTSWAPLQTPVQMYFWNPFGGQWTRVGDGNGSERTKPLLLLMMVSFDFPVLYGLLHTSRGTEVLRAVKNVRTEPGGDDRVGVWQTIGTGVSRMWTPQFTFYARTFLPGETVRFDIGGGVQSDTSDPFQDAAGTDTGDIFDDVYGRRLALQRLRPFLQARRLQAMAPGDPLPALEARVFDWSRTWDTREAFNEAFGQRFGGRVLHRMLARGWRFVEVAPASPDAGALGRTYTAQGNETPQAIAKRFDALARARWAAELKDVNPERDWTGRIYAGDVLAIPDAWPQPFWGAAKERGFLEASGPTGAPALAAADPFHELRAQQGRLS